jgi:hypothetical protein
MCEAKLLNTYKYKHFVPKNCNGLQTGIAPPTHLNFCQKSSFMSTNGGGGTAAATTPSGGGTVLLAPIMA